MYVKQELEAYNKPFERNTQKKMASLIRLTLLLLLFKKTVSVLNYDRMKGDVYSGNCHYSTSFENNDICNCNSNNPDFVGDKCTDEHVGCVKNKYDDALPQNVGNIRTIYVYDFINGTGIWNDKLSNTIKSTLLTRSADQLSRLKELLHGYLLKIERKDEKCEIIKFYGKAEFPLNKRDFSGLQSAYKGPHTTKTTTNKLTIKTTTAPTANKSKGFSTTTGILIGTISVLSLFLLIVLSIFLIRRRKQNNHKMRGEHMERPLHLPVYSIPELSSSPSTGSENLYSSASLPRYSDASLQSYSDRLHSFSDNGFATYADVGPAHYNRPEADYSSSPYNEPTLEPVYRVIEPEQSYQNQAITADYAVLEPEYQELEPELIAPSSTEYKNNLSNANKTQKLKPMYPPGKVLKPSVPMRPSRSDVPLDTTPSASMHHHENNLYNVTADDATISKQDNTEEMYAQVQK